MKNLVSTIVCISLFLSVCAQQSIGGLPLSFKIDEVKSQEFEWVEFTSINIEQTQIEDNLREQNGEIELFSRYIQSDLSPMTHGTWETLENGDRIWRLQVTSRDAKALNFIYSEFELANNSVLHIYSADSTMVLGGFTAANNKKAGMFATGNVLGESVILELFEPVADYGANKFIISKVGYVYRHVFAEINESNRDSYDRGSYECHINVACPEGDDWRDQEKGVVRIQMTLPSGQGFCSGSLINNTALDCKPYILSAWHCSGFAQPEDYATFIYYFNYQSTDCEGTIIGDIQSIAGSELRAHSGVQDNVILFGSDFVLTEITQPIPSSINAYWNGWNAMNTPSSSGVGMHHPLGDIKKIHTYASLTETGAWNNNIPETHWVVSWVPTESGFCNMQSSSSGSPLFNSDGLIMGQLTGLNYEFGSYDSEATAFYGKMSWNFQSPGENAVQFKDYLDPINSGALELEGSYDPCNEIQNNILELKEEEVTIYPNPASGTLFIELMNITDLEIRFYDALGKLALEDEILNTNAASIDLGRLNAGYYTVRLTDSKSNSLIKRIIVE